MASTPAVYSHAASMIGPRCEHEVDHAVGNACIDEGFDEAEGT
jgi:hypothetical protein